MTYSYYFASNTRTNAQIEGHAREDYAFKYVTDFIKQNNKDRAYIDCGVIWLEPDGSQGDWAVWCNYNDEPITAENADIGGNNSDMVSELEQLILA